jgi:hypothetical protein
VGRLRALEVSHYLLYGLRTEPSLGILAGLTGRVGRVGLAATAGLGRFIVSLPVAGLGRVTVGLLLVAVGLNVVLAGFGLAPTRVPEPGGVVGVFPSGFAGMTPPPFFAAPAGALLVGVLVGVFGPAPGFITGPGGVGLRVPLRGPPGSFVLAPGIGGVFICSPIGWMAATTSTAYAQLLP